MCQSISQRLTPFVNASDLRLQTPQTSHLAPHTSDLTPHDSHLTPHIWDSGLGTLGPGTWHLVHCSMLQHIFSVAQSIFQYLSPIFKVSVHFFSVSVHLSVFQSIFQCLSPFHCSVLQSIFQCLSSFVNASDLIPQTPQTSHLTPHTSDLTPHTWDLEPGTVSGELGLGLGPFFNASTHFSVPQSIFQCLSPICNVSVHFSVPQSIPRSSSQVPGPRQVQVPG